MSFHFHQTEYNKNDLSEEETYQHIKQAYKKHTKEAMELFEAAYPDKHPIDLLTKDRVFRTPSKELAHLHAQAGLDNTYLYEFALNFNFQHGKTAWHCSDIPFFFCNTERVEVCNIEGVTEVLENQMFSALIQFARKGNPNCPSIPLWPSVTPDIEPTMIFDRKCRVENKFDDELLKLMHQVLPKFNIMNMTKDVQH